MKKMLFLASVALLVISCSDPQKEAEKAVNNYLQQEFEDFRPIEFGDILADTLKYWYNDSIRWLVNDISMISHSIKYETVSSNWGRDSLFTKIVTDEDRRFYLNLYSKALYDLEMQINKTDTSIVGNKILCRFYFSEGEIAQGYFFVGKSGYVLSIPDENEKKKAIETINGISKARDYIDNCLTNMLVAE